MFKIGEILEGVKTLKRIRDQIAKRKNTDRVLTDWERNIRQNGKLIKHYLFTQFYAYNDKAPFVICHCAPAFDMEEATEDFINLVRTEGINIPPGWVNSWTEKKEVCDSHFVE